uniref:Uncharacterized protein n=1 Tax=Brassica oleracea var. oleracea TaxID=109376 RepID=A0A0D2ZPI6_BRAOL
EKTSLNQLFTFQLFSYLLILFTVFNVYLLNFTINVFLSLKPYTILNSPSPFRYNETEKFTSTLINWRRLIAGWIFTDALSLSSIFNWRGSCSSSTNMYD